MIVKAQEINLAKSAQNGDQEALGLLYDRYFPKVYSRVCSLLPYTDAEDVTQEIFLSMVRSIQTFRGDSSFSTWLYNIVKRRVADYYRKHNRLMSDIPMEPEIENQLPAVKNIPEDEEILIKQVLAQLGEQDREIILLRLVDGLPFAEIAKHLQIELGAAKLRFYRAVKKCKEQLPQIKV
ncbi:MAG: RNA polymerase sigma factor [Anaerolineaceae bacterium]|nr:RNA polymerase sigma factor [Anaerolineaceae bacterium]